MTLATVTITAVDADKRIIVNGEDITGIVRTAQLTLTPGDVPRLLIEFERPDTTFTGDGIVQTVLPSENPLEIVKRWVDALDAERLNTRAAEIADYGTTAGEAFKMALQEMLT